MNEDNIVDLTSDQVVNSSGEPVDISTPTSTGAESEPEPITTGGIEPDEPTVKRIANLAIVGTALMQRANDNSLQTDYLLAEGGLEEFAKGIRALNLDPVSRKGMEDLIAYLKQKVEKRLKGSVG